MAGVRPIRILFIGYAESSHSAAWVDLLPEGEFEIRFFAIPTLEPPVPISCPVYLNERYSGRRQNVDPDLHVLDRLRPGLRKTAIGVARRVAGIRSIGGVNVEALIRYTALGRPQSLRAALLDVLKSWKPDIVHTLGFDPAGLFYAEVLADIEASRRPRWVAQARGGPDLDVYPYLASRRPKIRQVFEQCDHFVCDNESNYRFARENGLARTKIESPGLGVISGTGGIDVEGISALSSGPPSGRERIVVWPKCYETLSAKALPVFEALNLAWDRIQPARIECLWLVQDEVRMWFEKMLRPELRQHCFAHGRIPREETLSLMSRARVMLSPSLTDGVPNAMMESMAAGAFPIVSPLATITPVVSQDENVLFARNLYPEEIAEALVRAMTDDELVDVAALNNLARVRQMSDRASLRGKVKAYYREIVSLARI